MSAKTDPARKLRAEAEAAKGLLAHLREQGHGDDEELVSDAIEGETSLKEVIASVVDEIDEGEVLIAGLKAKEQAFAERRRAIEERNERRRAAIEQAMIATEQDKLLLPTATVFISKRRPGLIVKNEADIPSEFFIEQERPAPKLDKKALIAALDEGREIPGAELDNGTISLSVRRK